MFPAEKLEEKQVRGGGKETIRGPERGQQGHWWTRLFGVTKLAPIYDCPHDDHEHEQDSCDLDVERAVEAMQGDWDVFRVKKSLFQELPWGW